jgi:hypothetical protein
MLWVERLELGEVLWVGPDDWPNDLPHVVTHGPIDPYLVGQAHFRLPCLLLFARQPPVRL